MKPINVPNLIPLNTVMNTTINSTAQQVYNVFIYNIQVKFTGTPTGTFKLQASADPAFSGKPTYPTNWSDIANSSFSVTAAGDCMWNAPQPGYNWVRIVYTDASSGASTAIITDSTFNAKGFQMASQYVDLFSQLGSSGGGSGFTAVHPPAGTNPSAATSATLNLTSSDGSLLSTGNSSTTTVDFTNPASATISAAAIDWSTTNVFKKTLAASTTFTFSNTSEKTIIVSLTNTASNWTVTWPVSVLWSGGTVPVQTTGAKTDIYTFIKIGTTVYGSVVQNF